MIAVYLGETDEAKIDDMSIVFFNSVLSMLGKRVNYDAVVNYAGNSFAKDSWKMIQEANPMRKPEKMGSAFVDLLNKSITQTDKKDETLSWMKAFKQQQQKEGSNEQTQHGE